MFVIGEYVVYGFYGICKIEGMEHRRIDHKDVYYYVLIPVEQENARYLVPLDNPKVVAKLRPILKKDELDHMLRSQDSLENQWINDENQRKQYYRELIASGDRSQWIRMLGMLYRHKEEQAAAGRKFHLCDENILRELRRILDGEFSVVLGIPKAEVENYILEHLHTFRSDMSIE